MGNWESMKYTIFAMMLLCFASSLSVTPVFLEGEGGETTCIAVATASCPAADTSPRPSYGVAWLSCAS